MCPYYIYVPAASAVVLVANIGLPVLCFYQDYGLEPSFELRAWERYCQVNAEICTQDVHAA